METKPGEAVSIIECDMSVDFAPPIGYQEPQRKIDEDEKQEEEEDNEVIDDDENLFKVFGGEGHRIDGKKKKNNVTYNVPVVKEIKKYVNSISYLQFK